MGELCEDLARRLEALRGTQKLLVSLLARATRLAESLEHGSKKLERELAGGSVPRAIPERRRERRFEGLLKQLAEPGASALEIRFDYDFAFVRIDGAEEFDVAARPALFLEIISTGTRPLENDGFCRWHSHREIAELLNRAPGRHILPESVTNLVHRLRKTLVKNGANPFYVETQELKGVRFRYRRRKIDRDPPHPGPLAEKS